MRNFLDDNFLLHSPTAERLYHDYAKSLPIIDYHCHIPAKEIAENNNYADMAEIWLKHDHYKWRAMRSNGIPENGITGTVSGYKRFCSWAATLPYCIGNPLYHWTHLELRRYFGITVQLSTDSAEYIWDNCNQQLTRAEFRPQSIIKSSNVDWLCTTDDPADDLCCHAQLRREGNVKVFPTFRPDKYVNIDNAAYIADVAGLAVAAAADIKNFSEFLAVFSCRLNHFADNKCFLSDHALEYAVYRACDERQAAKIFARRLSGKALSPKAVEKFKSFMLIYCAKEYVSRGWTMQLHLGAIRNNNSEMFRKLGPDSGFDSIGDAVYAKNLAQLLDAMNEQCGGLPKTIIYNLNSRDNEVIGTLIGCFQSTYPGKIQFGSGWWFNDQKDGMIRQMTTLGNLGLLSKFVGMLTDSRSVLSYTRHEYFRRILCNLLGEWVENGEYPADWDMLKKIVRGICYENAKNYFAN
ncbi:MAG: glucuronate isomerase [Negativicutes bacterium]|jgi:glucuronate isomerase